MMKNHKDTHRRTVWVDESLHHELASTPISFTDLKPSQTRKEAIEGVTSSSRKPRLDCSVAKIPQLYANPWDTFEPVARLQDQSWIFARRRTSKGAVVHVQQLQQQMPNATALLEMMDQVAHPSFLKLLECYQYDTSCMLIWEPTEVSVDQILASSCLITADEISCIVKPILEGILHLRRLGRALATLSPGTILVTYSGDVKIVGVENSCKIHESEMNSATIKLCALADIVKKLMLKNLNYEWELEIQNLPYQLENVPLEKLLQNEIFNRESSEEELKLLVSVTNKTAYHGVKTYYAR
ncbi:uncharacterized protein N7511_003498 [Penicillium nucicola]|uniref:uncharacterized protein n=1 Tax=Penicillium nucicola TaxID=1850975 RepID=UPI002544DA4B|nr:uncharacterized protein N7511_003498 [Penicillium nucicola]KAJ5771447.1 hypothetical protein N7511_003498 [Penicillium nucicola]